MSHVGNFQVSNDEYQGESLFELNLDLHDKETEGFRFGITACTAPRRIADMQVNKTAAAGLS